MMSYSTKYNMKVYFLNEIKRVEDIIIKQNKKLIF